MSNQYLIDSHMNTTGIDVFLCLNEYGYRLMQVRFGVSAFLLEYNGMVVAARKYRLLKTLNQYSHCNIHER